MFEPYRRLKDEDPIIPFGEGPIISKWGAISRASRTGYHTTDPIQATALQGRAGTTSINFRGKNLHPCLCMLFVTINPQGRHKGIQMQLNSFNNIHKVHKIYNETRNQETQ